MAYFPSSSSSYCFSGKRKPGWLPDITISTSSAHFCVWVCEVKYACSQCQLSFAPLSPQCKDKGWTIPQRCIDEGWWKQLNGQNTGLWWAVSRSLCRQVHFTALRVPWSDSLRRNVIRNSTMGQDSLWLWLGGCWGGHSVMWECTDGSNAHLSLPVLSDGRA